MLRAVLPLLNVGARIPVCGQIAGMTQTALSDGPDRTGNLTATVLVKRGQTVLMSVGQAQGFQITARVEALQDGRMGEKVQLKNSESGKILSGVVKGPNSVQGY